MSVSVKVVLSCRLKSLYAVRPDISVYAGRSDYVMWSLSLVERYECGSCWCGGYGSLTVYAVGAAGYEVLGVCCSAAVYSGVIVSALVSSDGCVADLMSGYVTSDGSLT